ncbi:unnamed protein product [Ilex paraguariensis]|uniref:Nuclear pore complex protein NUP43 n=1 Tax=Ilex paraguariensis TaxID=185542 RepID=A0ABC8THM0_9AQUA
MAVNGTSNILQVQRIPQSKYTDALRFLPSISPFNRFVILALFDSDSNNFSLETLNLTPSKTPNLNPQSSLTLPSRINSLKVSQTPQKPLIAASTFSGSLHILSSNPLDGYLKNEALVHDKGFHVGPISCVDVSENGSQCVSVGEDGRVNLVKIGDSGVDYSRVFDSNGLVSYTAAKWASPTEFATGGLGFSLLWWDQRRPGGPVSQFKGNWAQRTAPGLVHSIDIHPSRKHTCVAGGSSGTVFAWDLRWQQQPIILSGLGIDDAPAPSESEVWEVQYDSYTHSSNIGGISSSRVLPVMICSEDGILAVIEQGGPPMEILAEPCAINSFDIDRQSPSDVICSLEWESVAILTRP